jgi:hypothetical protein
MIRIPTFTASSGEYNVVIYSGSALATGDFNTSYVLDTRATQEPMTVDQVLARCSNLATRREEIWPNGTEVQEQLFGNLEQLHQTTMVRTVHLRVRTQKSYRPKETIYR